MFCRPVGMAHIVSVQPSFKRFVQSWLINTFAVVVAVYIVPGIHFNAQGILPPFLAALVLGVLNAFLRPVMMFLAWPLLLFTLGLFMLVINALVLYTVGLVLGQYFEVDGFGSALLGALIISIVSTVLNVVTGLNRSRVRVERRKRSRPDRHDDDGPIIDV